LQEPFSLDGSSRSGLWDVPITLSCASTTEKFLVKQKYDKLDSCGKQEKDGKFLIKLNINETGFYRVKYDKEIADQIQNALQANMFSSIEKIGNNNIFHYEVSLQCFLRSTITLVFQALWRMHVSLPWPAKTHFLHCYIYCMLFVKKHTTMF
jgi:puromycin-sensitive aminopeptidase